jgi:hypothetical protein
MISTLVLMSVTASAHDWHDGHYDNDKNWIHTHHNGLAAERGLPFAWHERFNSMREHHHLERIYDREWSDRFPGLHAYRWSSPKGFWHHGNYVKDAVFFYDENDELVSVGYMENGVFINFREDHESYENHDSFFLSWFHR